MTYASIALVDLSYIITRNHKARSSDTKLSAAEVAEYAGQATMQEIDAIRVSVEHVVLCLDSAPYWRTSEYPEYKGTRPEPDPALTQVKRNIYDRIKADGYSIAKVEGFEADDLIATLAQAYSKTCPDVRIVSADKDCAQCVTDRVRMFVPKVGKRPEEIRGPAEVKAKFGVQPKDMALYQALIGDTSDNVPGVDKVGAKTAAEWINTHGGTLIKLGIALAEKADLGEKMPVSWRNFGEAYPRMKFWLRMTTLRTDVPIDAEALLVKREAVKLVDDAPEEQGDAYEGPSMPTQEELEQEAALMTGEMTANDDNGQRLANELGKGVAGFVPFGTPNKSCDLHEDCALADKNVAEFNVRSGKPMGPATHEHKRPGTELWRVKPPLVPAPRPLPDPNAKAFLLEQDEQRKREAILDKAGEKFRGGPPMASEVKAMPAVTEAVFTEPPKPAKPPKASPEERIEAGEFDGKAKSSALAVIPPNTQEWNLALQPRSAGEAIVIAKVLFNSRKYGHFGLTEGAVFNIIATGRELGLSMMQALNGFHDVKGKPYAGWRLVKTLAERHPDCEWIRVKSADATRAVCETKHRVHGLMEYEYTIERARKAGLFGQNKENWDGKPQEMCTKTAVMKGCWEWYTSALIGLPLASDESDSVLETTP